MFARSRHGRDPETPGYRAFPGQRVLPSRQLQFIYGGFVDSQESRFQMDMEASEELISIAKGELSLQGGRFGLWQAGPRRDSSPQSKMILKR